jgi:hypothetical protein
MGIIVVDEIKVLHVDYDAGWLELFFSPAAVNGTP